MSDVKFDVLTRLHTGLYVVRPQLRFNRNKFVSFQFRGVYVRGSQSGCCFNDL